MRWELKTEICTFIIVPYKGEYALYVDDELLQTAESPEAIADNVFTHTSEFYEWDVSSLDCEDSLSAWTFFRS